MKNIKKIGKKGTQINCPLLYCEHNINGKCTKDAITLVGRELKLFDKTGKLNIKNYDSFFICKEENDTRD